MDQSTEDLKRLVEDQQARLEAFEAAAEQSAVSAAITGTLATFVTEPGSYVKPQLGGPGHRYFVSGGVDEQPASTLVPTPRPVPEPFELPGETLGAAMVRRATTPQPERPDPRLDPSQPLSFGWHLFREGDGCWRSFLNFPRLSYGSAA